MVTNLWAVLGDGGERLSPQFPVKFGSLREAAGRLREAGPEPPPQEAMARLTTLKLELDFPFFVIALSFCPRTLGAAAVDAGSCSPELEW